MGSHRGYGKPGRKPVDMSLPAEDRGRRKPARQRKNRDGKREKQRKSRDCGWG